MKQGLSSCGRPGELSMRTPEVESFFLAGVGSCVLFRIILILLKADLVILTRGCLSLSSCSAIL